MASKWIFPPSPHSLAYLLITLGSDQDFDARLVDVVDVGPVGLDLRILNAAGETVNGSSGSKTKIIPRAYDRFPTSPAMQKLIGDA